MLSALFLMKLPSNLQIRGWIQPRPDMSRPAQMACDGIAREGPQSLNKTIYFVSSNINFIDNTFYLVNDFFNDICTINLNLT